MSSPSIITSLKIAAVNAWFARANSARHVVADIVEQNATAILVPAIKSSIIRNNLVFEGTLRDSIKSVIAARSNTTCLVQVGAFTNYASYFEYGRAPGTAFSSSEMSKLTNWVTRKLATNNPASTATAISEKIKRQGMAARPFFVTTAQANERILVEKVYDDIILFLRTVA